MLVSDFDFVLPDDRIAATPAEPRDAARLLVYDRRTRAIVHTVFSELPALLAPGDLLVLNDTRVLPHRLLGRRESGGRVEVLILSREGAECRGYVKPARKVRPGDRVALEDGSLLLEAQAAEADGILRFRLLAADGATDVDSLLQRLGRAPLPPYIRRDGSEDPAADRARYQTVFAAVPGAVAAPTAGLHFTERVFARLAARGIAHAFVTLHVGPGTFTPVRVERVAEHEMHAEEFSLPAATAERIAAARGAGGRVVAVGTTAARTLESCASPDRLVRAGYGSTRLFLYPGQPLLVVDALLTNFHLPRSTLLMLVAAMTGREEILRVYREAIERGYRFYSYGDAMLVL